MTQFPKYKIYSHTKNRYLAPNEFTVKNNDIIVNEYGEMKKLQNSCYAKQELINETTITGEPVYTDDKVSFIVNEEGNNKIIEGHIYKDEKEDISIYTEDLNFYKLEDVTIMSVIEEEGTRKSNRLVKIGIKFHDNDFVTTFRTFAEAFVKGAERELIKNIETTRNTLYMFLQQYISTFYYVAQRGFPHIAPTQEYDYVKSLVKNKDILINSEVDVYLAKIKEDNYYWDNSEFLLIDFEGYNGTIIKIY